MAGEMAYMRRYYSVPAKRGMWVKIYSPERPWVLLAEGVISSSNGNYFWLKHGPGCTTGPCHPKYGVVYFDKDGSVLLDTR